VPAGAVFLSSRGDDSAPGTEQAPVATLNRALQVVPRGGTVVVRAGIYRDWYHSGDTYAVLQKRVTLQAFPHEQVWFDGTDVLPASAWSPLGQGAVDGLPLHARALRGPLLRAVAGGPEPQPQHRAVLALGQRPGPAGADGR
ncbi:MAG: DUF1565 domain-containing protein, partial [Quadrisphaera sp.]